jgi:uncharacterized protein with NAD-binding domain and iron-sulfur cluster
MAKRKIAILGGGMGALAAALELTSYTGWNDKYDVTVYQSGWRLGGKCATGRNAAIRNRIEEHGIHFLLGFYDNAFHLIRKLYDEYLQYFPSPFRTWREAFRKQSTTTAMAFDAGEWFPFGIIWPPNEQLPGDDALFLPNANPPAAWDYISKILDWMRGQVAALETQLEFNREVDPDLHTIGNLIDSSYEISLKYAVPPPADTPDLNQILESMKACGERLFFMVRSRPLTRYAKQVLILLDVAAAMVGGMIVDGVIFEGFEKIDGKELMCWLTDNGCHFPDSTVVRSGYDACFAYLGGDPKRPNMSAAVGMHGALRLWFTYRGAIFWPMQAGMAEVIFTPMYRVLSRRGVSFQFFQRIQHLGLSGNGKAIQKVEIDVQAQLKNPAAGYKPFITVKGLECWPNAPLYDQLVNGDALKGYDLESAWAAPPRVSKTTLVRGKDFDDVILGISLGALPAICSDLLAASSTWREMVAHVPTVQTQALQLWLKATADQLGYSSGTVVPSADAACVSSFVEPFDTYVDMSAIKDREEWLPADHTSHLAYFCNAMPDAAMMPPPGTDPGFPERQRQVVKENAITFLTQFVKSLWPGSAIGADGFGWDLLVDVTGSNGVRRLDSQYYRANIDPSARYVLSPPGAIKYRLLPHSSGFDNLYLAGDWTYTPMNSGCVEAATMSGFKTAQAISGYPPKIYGWD